MFVVYQTVWLLATQSTARAAGRCEVAGCGFAQLCAWGLQCPAVPVWAVGPFADRRVLARKRGAP
jgi:hypothetical protein